MHKKEPRKAVNIRVFEDTRSRLKVKAAQKDMSIMNYVEFLSKIIR